MQQNRHGLYINHIVLLPIALFLVSFPAYALNLCGQRFSIDIGDVRLELPYCASQSLEIKDSNIDRLVVAIHGRGSIAPEYLKRVQEAGEKAPSRLAKTLIIAPQFLDSGDHQEVPVDVNDVYWTSGVGCWGGLSTGDFPKRVSTFHFLDELLTSVITNSCFPNLERIVIAGHSAGGQFVNRYAASSPFEDQIAKRRGVSVRYIVANPFCYVYFNGERAVPGTMDVFSLPDVDDCPKYNQYGFGPEDIYRYHKNNGRKLFREAYPKRNVIYLVGERDNEPMDGDCQVMLQGRNRLERATIYFNYLQHLFGPSLLEKQVFRVVSNAGHSSRQIFTSRLGVAYLFDYPGDPMKNRVVLP